MLLTSIESDLELNCYIETCEWSIATFFNEKAILKNMVSKAFWKYTTLQIYKIRNELLDNIACWLSIFFHCKMHRFYTKYLNVIPSG